MRKLSGKTINSLALCVALAAPLVYLFGTLFMTLAGAHGEQMVEDTPTLNQDVTYFGEYLRNTQVNPTVGQPLNMVYNQNNGTVLIRNLPQGSYEITFEQAPEVRLVKYINGLCDGYPLVSSPTTYTVNNEGDFCALRLYFGYQSPEIYNFKITALDTSFQEFNTKVNYSEYLFGQFFSKENFLAESGRQVLQGTPNYGFVPIGELVRYTDANMLHLANLSYGPLVIGYTYYCAHVIIVDLIFYIASFIPRLIKKSLNKLEGGVD